MVAKGPKTMRAAVVTGFGQPVEIQEDFAVPDLKPWEVLVKIEYSGVCFTDLHTTRGDWVAKPLLPVVIGHEGTGTIFALGETAQAKNSMTVGDPVGISWVHGACGHCDACLSGWESVCARLEPVGFSRNGCHAEYVAVDAQHVIKIPSHMSLAHAAPVMCAGVTAYKGLKLSRVRPGQWVVIFGAGGGIGHLAVQYARAMGMKVCAVDQGRDRIQDLMDVKDERRRPHVAIDSYLESNLINKLKTVCHPEGPHGALVVAPNLETYGTALSTIRPRGVVVALSIPPGGSLPINPADLVLHSKTIVGSVTGSRLDLIEALRFANEGKVVCKIAERSLDDLNDAFDDIEAHEVTGCIVLRIAD